MQNKWQVLSFRYELYTGKDENLYYIVAIYISLFRYIWFPPMTSTRLT